MTSCKDLRKASNPETGDPLLRARSGRGLPLTTWTVRVIHDRTFTGKNCAMPGTQKTGPDTTAKCDIRSFCKSVFFADQFLNLTAVPYAMTSAALCMTEAEL